MRLRSIARLVAGSLAVAAAAGLAGTVQAKTNSEEPQNMHFAWEGPVGKFDQGQLQRGYKVYREVCSSCHSMSLVYFRNLGQPGGPFFDAKHPNPNDSPVVKTLAADFKVPDIDADTGDPSKRVATPADHMPAPYPNEAAARASNGGALPPDFSVLVKAREGGPNYIYSLITGYSKSNPHGLTVPAGKYYNPYMPGDMASYWTGPKDKVPEGGFIAMPFQLTPNRVQYDDGTKATTAQMAKDVVAFMSWASEPKQIERKQTGWAVLLYLIGFAVVLYASYRRIWRNVAH